MQKISKRLGVPSLLFLLMSCGTTTIIKEVQVTEPPTTSTTTTTTVSEDYWTMTSSEGIEWIRDNAPSLASSSDSELYSVMSSACDMIISWAPDYDGWLEVFIENVSKKSTEDRSNMMAVVVAATRSNCTDHLEEVLTALDKG